MTIPDWRESIARELARPEIAALVARARTYEQKQDWPGRLSVSIAAHTLECVADGRLELVDVAPDHHPTEYKSVACVKAIVKWLRQEAGIG